LNIDDNLSALGLELHNDFSDTVCPARVVGAGQACLEAFAGYPIENLWAVGRNDDALRSASLRLLSHPHDHWFSANISQWFVRKPARCSACGDDGPE
jgi:hypothetical protein